MIEVGDYVVVRPRQEDWLAWPDKKLQMINRLFPVKAVHTYWVDLEGWAFNNEWLYKVGDVVRVVDTPQPNIENGAHWADMMDSYCGCEFVIQEISCNGYLKLGVFNFHPTWVGPEQSLQNIKKEPHKCVCDWDVVYAKGCQCGGT